jgi:acetoin utilization deacetylase AcuC-like enzyme
MKTGVFWHNIFATSSWPIIGNKFENFPSIMEQALKLEGVKLFTPNKVSWEVLKKVHNESVLNDLRRAWYCEGALYSVGGCIEAALKILGDELDNALVFDVGAGHHAGPTRAWGGTYISCTGPTIVSLREKYGKGRYAIIDTDSHHGDGTRAVFMGDRDVLHICFCSSNHVEDEATKICVNVGYNTSDHEYLGHVEREFIPRVRDFKPDIIFHLLGHDTARGDYGDRGLTDSFYLELVEMIKSCAEEICGGKYMIITHGGSRKDLAEYIFPKIIEILAR